MKAIALILSLFCLPLFAAGDAPELIPVEKPQRTAAQDIADKLAEDINAEISRRVELHQSLFQSFWKNPDATPEQIAEALGTKARTFFAVAAENVAHIERLAKLVGKTLDDFLPAADRERPKDILINPLDELGTEASDVFDDASALVGFLLGQHTGRPIVADFAPEFYTPPCTYTHHADGTITLN